MLQDLHHTGSQWRCEVLENEVGIGFGDCAQGRVGDVVAENDIVEGEAGRRPVGEMGDRKRRGRSSVLVEEDEIGEA